MLAGGPGPIPGRVVLAIFSVFADCSAPFTLNNNNNNLIYNFICVCVCVCLSVCLSACVCVCVCVKAQRFDISA